MKSRMHRQAKTIAFAFFLIVAVISFVLIVKPHSQLASNLGAQEQPPAHFFMWVGAQRARFTPQQLGQIANRTSFVVVAPFHNGGDIVGTKLDIQQLKKLQPGIKVMAYINATTVNPSMSAEMKNNGFSDEWLLRADRGTNIGAVMTLSAAKDSVQYVDISRTEYQDWLMEFLQSQRYDGDLYDGVVFDSFNSKGVPVDERFVRPEYWQGLQYWQTQLSDQAIAANDAGLSELLSQTKKLNPTKLVGINGFSEKPFRAGPEHRNEPYYDAADFMITEEFCAHADEVGNIVYASTDEILHDLSIMRDVRGITKLFQVNAVNPNNSLQTSSAMNYCYGVFLAGAYDESMIGGGRYKVEDTLRWWPRGITVDFGEAVTDFEFDSGRSVLSREYERGLVLSNLSAVPVSFPAPVTGWIAGHLLNGASNQSYAKGSLIPMQPRSSYFLIRSDKAAAGDPPA